MKLELEQLEGRITPSITYGGGPVVNSVALAVVNHDPANATFIQQLAQVSVQIENQVPQLTQYYGLTPGLVNRFLSINPSSTNPSDADVQSELSQKITAGILPQPTSNQVYLDVLGPDQVITDPWAGKGIGGYHSWFLLNGKIVWYGVIYDLPLQQLSQAFLHELLEIQSNPGAGKSLPGFELAFTGWSDKALAGNGEIADIWAWNQLYQFSVDGFLFSALAAPDNSPIIVPVVGSGGTGGEQKPAPTIPTFQQLIAIPFQQFKAWEFFYLSKLNPSYQNSFEQAQSELASNPALYTPQGQLASTIGTVAFFHLFS